MEKILLLNPPSSLFSGQFSYIMQIANSLPSLGICSLAANAANSNRTFSVLDCAALGINLKECLGRITDFSPDVLGISAYSSTINVVIKLIRLIKEELQDIFIVLGGPHLTAIGTALPDIFTDIIDVGVIGEGEETFTELLLALENSISLNKVAGLIYKNNGNWKLSEYRKPIENLDKLEFPELGLLPGFPNNYAPPIFSYDKGPSAPIITSRGCPYKCNFCDHSVFGYKYRTFSINYIVSEIEFLKKNFGINHILFVDDHLSLKKKRLHKLCNSIIEKKLDINWTADVRADSLSVDDLIIMKKAGCIRINCGLETGSKNLLTAMNKKLNIEKAEHTLMLANTIGIQTKGLFIIGFPGENDETIAETKRFITNIPLTEINLSRFSPYPGTKYYNSFQGCRTTFEYWELLDGLHFCNLDKSKVVWLKTQYFRLLFTFYSRPTIFINYLKLFIKFSESRQRIIKFLIGLFKSIFFKYHSTNQN